MNGKYGGNDEIGKLIYDFSCTNSDDMNYEALARGQDTFSRTRKGAKEKALKMIKNGKISIDEVSEYFPE